MFHPFTISLILWLGTMCSTSFIQWRFYKRLRTHHQEIWNRLGSPTMWSDRNLAETRKTIDKLMERVYLEIDDPEGQALCERHRKPFHVFYYANIVTIIGFFAMAILFGTPD